MGCIAVHYQNDKGFQTLCGMNHFYQTTNVGGLSTTNKKDEVTCKKCLKKMIQWGWIDKEV